MTIDIYIIGGGRGYLCAATLKIREIVESLGRKEGSRRRRDIHDRVEAKTAVQTTNHCTTTTRNKKREESTQRLEDTTKNALKLRRGPIRTRSHGSFCNVPNCVPTETRSASFRQLDHLVSPREGTAAPVTPQPRRGWNGKGKSPVSETNTG